MARVRAQATTFNRSSKRFTSKTFRNYGGGYDGGAGQQRKNLYEEEVEIDTGAYVPQTYDGPKTETMETKSAALLSATS